MSKFNQIKRKFFFYLICIYEEASVLKKYEKCAIIQLMQL